MVLRKAQGKLQKNSKVSSKKLPITMAELLAATGYKIPSLRRGQEVTGTVVAATPHELLIDIGAKSEGVVTGKELDAVKELASGLSVGDKIDATVVYPENDAGQVVLSLRKLSGEKRWSELEEKLRDGEDVEVVALEVNRGGIICDFVGIRGFLPASQLTQPPQKLTDLIGKNLTVRIIEADKQSNRLILSQKQPSRADLGQILKLLEKVEIGQKVKGSIGAVLPFGVFVEIDVGRSGNQAVRRSGKRKEPDSPKTRQLFEPEPIRSESPGRRPQSRRPDSQTKLEGLVHISEIAWERVEDPATLYKVGDKVEAMVVAKDGKTGRLNLSFKQLAKDPFLEVSQKYTKDQNVKGSVIRITSYGVFVMLQDPSNTLGTSNIEGLIHVSKIPPNLDWQVGQLLECTIDSIDTKARRIALVPVTREKPILYR